MKKADVALCVAWIFAVITSSICVYELYRPRRLELKAPVPAPVLVPVDRALAVDPEGLRVFRPTASVCWSGKENRCWDLGGDAVLVQAALDSGLSGVVSLRSRTYQLAAPLFIDRPLTLADGRFEGSPNFPAIVVRRAVRNVVLIGLRIDGSSTAVLVEAR